MVAVAKQNKRRNEWQSAGNKNTNKCGSNSFGDT